jgi:NADPH:quinone reductase-like Zn-dependent oxidoreductase
MKAVVYRRYGGPEVLEDSDVTDPKVSQTSVLVRVRAADLPTTGLKAARSTVRTIDEEAVIHVLPW